MELFSKRLRTLRMEKGMKQSELAEALHFSQGMASAYENGREPPFDVLVQIANYFDVSADYLLGLTSMRKQNTDALMTETNCAAKQTESVGVVPIAPEDIRALMAAITAYTDERCPVGTAPLVLSRDIILKLTEMLKALNNESAAGVLDTGNALIKSVLDVSNITSEYLTRNE